MSFLFTESEDPSVYETLGSIGFRIAKSIAMAIAQKLAEVFFLVLLFIGFEAQAAKTCADAIDSRHTNNNFQIINELKNPLFQALDAGPNVWVNTNQVNNKPNGFQRGFSIFSEAVGALSEQPLPLNGAVMRLGPQIRTGLRREAHYDYLDEYELHRSVKKYAKPLAVRGKSDQELKIPRYAGALIGEGFIPKGQIITRDITQIGIFSPHHDELFYVWGTVKWVEQYVEFYNFAKSQGFRFRQSTRGQKFHQKILNAYDQIDSNYLELLSEEEKLDHELPSSYPRLTEVRDLITEILESRPPWVENLRQVLEEFSVTP